MSLRFTNTLTGALEEFRPLEGGRVRMYTCGPTVYDRAHIGNFRTFVWEDLLRRYLEWKGYEVTQVMNLTDVDDRTIGAAVEGGVGLSEVTRPVIEAFFEDWETLGLEPVEHNPRATEHIPQMIELVRTLEGKGHTYESEGSVYFAIASFPGYGRLIQLDPSRLRGSGRVSGDEEYSKEDPRDFVLWKGAARGPEAEVAVWDSPWGPGRPGWHLECSAMAMEYLGPRLDIHTGGVDNIFPHHVNEMAQSEASTGEPFARYWLHAAHLLVDGEKMSKSLGNFYTIPDLLALGCRPSAIRYLLLSGHYRSHLNFTLEGVRQADRALDRLIEFGARVRKIGETAGSYPSSGEIEAVVERARGEFVSAMDEDLNVSEALAAIFRCIRDVNGLLDRSGDRASREEAAAVLSLLTDFDAIFGVVALRKRELSEVPPTLRAWVEERIAQRNAARAARDFARADAIRDEVAERGFALEDTPEGTRWKWAGAPSGAVPGSAAPR